MALVNETTTRLAAQSSDQKSIKKKSAQDQWGPSRQFLLQILELCSNGQRLQHRLNRIIGDTGKEEPGAAGRQSTDDFQSLQAWIRSISRDMDALDHSCSAETAMGFPACKWQPQLQPASPEKPAKKGRTSSLAFLLLLSFANGSIKNRKSIASTAGTSDAAGHEERAVRQWRIFLSSDERVKLKARERRAQKFSTAIHHEVTLFTVITWFFHLHQSAPLDPNVICTHNCPLKCETSLVQTWMADVAQHLCEATRAALRWIRRSASGLGAEPWTNRARKGSLAPNWH